MGSWFSQEPEAAKEVVKDEEDDESRRMRLNDQLEELKQEVTTVELKLFTMTKSLN